MNAYHSQFRAGAAGISGSSVPYSTRSRLLLIRALDRITASLGGRAELIELSLLPAEALLGRRKDAAVERAATAVARARIVVASTPVRQASYSGVLKAFLDLLPCDALEGKVALPIVVGSEPGHGAVLELALGPALLRLGAAAAAGGVYGSEGEFFNGSPDPGLVERVDRAVESAIVLARAVGLASDLEVRPSPGRERILAPPFQQQGGEPAARGSQ